jgi:hypothetical protein
MLLLSVIVALCLLAAFVAPAVFAVGLLRSGWMLHRWGMGVLGAVLAVGWVYAAVRIVSARRTRSQ